jgi:dissimilatory sulfite reductase (desulfoviridin) alpha/beta subunit
VFNFDLVKDNISKISEICNKSFDVYEERSKIGENKFQYFIGRVGAKMFSGVMMKCFFGNDNLDEEI